MAKSFFLLPVFIIVLLFSSGHTSAIKGFSGSKECDEAYSEGSPPSYVHRDTLRKEGALDAREWEAEEMDEAIDVSLRDVPLARRVKRLRPSPAAKRLCLSATEAESSLEREETDGEDEAEAGYASPDEGARRPMHVVFSPGEDGGVRMLETIVGDLLPPTPSYPKLKRSAATPLKKAEERRRKRLAIRSDRRRHRWEKLSTCVPAPAMSVLEREQLAFAPLRAYIAERKDLVLQRTTDQTPLDRLSVLAKLRRSLIIGGGHFSRVVSWKGRGGDRYVIQADSLIDLERRDSHGMLNLDRMLRGKAPIGPDGRRVQLHHAVQSDDYEIVEVSHTLHISGVHFKRVPATNPVVYEDPLAARKLDHSIDRGAFASFRVAYWRERAHSLRETAHVLERSARVRSLFGIDEEVSTSSTAGSTSDSELSDESICRTPLSRALTPRLSEGKWPLIEGVEILPA